MAKKLSLQEQATEILKQAEERGVSSNFFFATTFKRYQVQMRILSDLEVAIEELCLNSSRTLIFVFSNSISILL